MIPPFDMDIIWLVVWNMFYFSIYWECHHPNWTFIFFRGVDLNHQPVMIAIDFVTFQDRHAKFGNLAMANYRHTQSFPPVIFIDIHSIL
jgi:hypothetical protein